MERKVKVKIFFLSFAKKKRSFDLFLCSSLLTAFTTSSPHNNNKNIIHFI